MDLVVAHFLTDNVQQALGQRHFMHTDPDPVELSEKIFQSLAVRIVDETQCSGSG
jgi:hypothetical protein